MFVSGSFESDDDGELIVSYKKSGDIAVLGQLYSRYTSLVFGVCLKYLKDRDDAKDAVMQVFEKLVAGLRQHDVSNFRSWLYVTARNHCLMQLRAKKGRFVEEIDSERMESELILHPGEEPELELNLSKLERCIEKLSDDQQQCVRLFFLEEKCYRDITVATGYNLNQVKSYIQNGKRNLRICMEQSA